MRAAKDDHHVSRQLLEAASRAPLIVDIPSVGKGLVRKDVLVILFLIQFQHLFQQLLVFWHKFSFLSRELEALENFACPSGFPESTRLDARAVRKEKRR